MKMMLRRLIEDNMMRGLPALRDFTGIYKICSRNSNHLTSDFTWECLDPRRSRHWPRQRRFWSCCSRWDTNQPQWTRWRRRPSSADPKSSSCTEHSNKSVLMVSLTRIHSRRFMRIFFLWEMLQSTLIWCSNALIRKTQVGCHNICLTWGFKTLLEDALCGDISASDTTNKVNLGSYIKNLNKLAQLIFQEE